MRRAWLAWSHAALGLLAFAGCANSPYSTSGQANKDQQTAQAATQTKALEDQKKALDRDNLELETQLAQARQQTLLVNDRLALMKEQLGTATNQLAQLRDERQGMEKKLQQLAANPNLNNNAGGAGAPAVARRNVFSNSSLSSKLPDLRAAGIEVRTVDDIVRIELPADRLFDPNDARLRRDALELINNVVIEVERAYPQQYIAIEGHMDNEPPAQGAPNVHQLSTNRAYSVFEYLTLRSRLRASQMSVVGYGANHPIVSNATAQGRARNRRVEIVVYPERVGER
jgi:flagellar motor protein MotB